VKSVSLSRSFVSGLRRLPGFRSWSHHREILQRYEAIVREPWNPGLYSDTDELHIGEIEINKNCNLNCAMCNTGLSTRPQMNMELDLFERAVLFAKSMKNPRTSLHTIGEPLMNPKLPQYFEILRKYGVEVFLSTNALLLEKRLDLLIENADLIYDLRF